MNADEVDYRLNIKNKDRKVKSQEILRNLWYYLSVVYFKNVKSQFKNVA